MSNLMSSKALNSAVTTPEAVKTSEMRRVERNRVTNTCMDFIKV
jgi:hypothetical protein